MPQLAAIGVVASDLERSRAFYRLLGVEIAEGDEHVEATLPNGMRLMFDTDDLIFAPELIRHFAVFDGWPEPELLLEVAKLDGYRRTLEACDAASVTTEPLREHARRHVEHVQVVPNAVSEEMVRLADAALRWHREEEAVTIAYFSGTRTHNRDFLEAADAVLWALQAYPQVRFQAVGKLELDERFEQFQARVQRIPMRPWQALPDLLRRIEINLAPLRRRSPARGPTSFA